MGLGPSPGDRMVPDDLTRRAHEDPYESSLALLFVA